MFYLLSDILVHYLLSPLYSWSLENSLIPDRILSVDTVRGGANCFRGRRLHQCTVVDSDNRDKMPVMPALSDLTSVWLLYLICELVLSSSGIQQRTTVHLKVVITIQWFLIT